MKKVGVVAARLVMAVAGGGTAGNSGIISFAMAHPARDALRDAHVLDRALQHHQQERDEPQQHQLCHQRFKMKP